jgi:hypothetical protein
VFFGWVGGGGGSSRVFVLNEMGILCLGKKGSTRDSDSDSGARAAGNS